METQKIWAKVLKCLRENNEQMLLSVVSNLQIIFTHETITIFAQNKSTFDILTKYKDILDLYSGNKNIINIKMFKQSKEQISIEKKLINFFGDKLEIDV